MLNPWLSLQAARLGWETQSLVVDQMMWLAGVGNSGRQPMAVPERNKEAPPAPAAPVVRVAALANRSTHPQVVQQVIKNQKKHRRVKKHRRSQ
jgi:hypothetical protein